MGFFIIIRGIFGNVKLDLPAVLTGCRADVLPEDFAEIAETAESHGRRDLGDSPVTAPQMRGYRLMGDRTWVTCFCVWRC